MFVKIIFNCNTITERKEFQTAENFLQREFCVNLMLLNAYPIVYDVTTRKYESERDL